MLLVESIIHPVQELEELESVGSIIGSLAAMLVNELVGLLCGSLSRHCPANRLAAIS